MARSPALISGVLLLVTPAFGAEPPPPDVEVRRAAVPDGGSVRADGLAGLPAEVADRARAAAGAAVAEIGDEYPRRPAYEWRKSKRLPAYPLRVDYRTLETEPVPLALLPSAAELEGVEPAGEAAGAPGRTEFFRAGPGTAMPVTLPALPPHADTAPYGIFQAVDTLLATGRFTTHRAIPLAEENNDDWVNALKLGEPGGATRLGTLTTVRARPDNPRVLRATLEVPGEPPRSWWAFAMVPADGMLWGGDPDRGLSRFALPLDSPAHDPHFDKHSLLRLPQAGVRRDPGDPEIVRAMQVLAMDEWFADRPQKLWALRERADSRPFRERFVLLPADEPSDLRLHSLYLFAGWGAERIAEELRTLTVPADQTEPIPPPPQ